MRTKRERGFIVAPANGDDKAGSGKRDSDSQSSFGQPGTLSPLRRPEKYSCAGKRVAPAAALGCLDRSEDARIAVQRLIELVPGITVATAVLSARYVDPKNIAALEKRVAPCRVARRMTANRCLAADVG